MQQWRGAGDAGDVFHGGAIKVPDPDANGELGGIAESPIVSEVRAGASLAGDRKCKSKRRFCAERQGTRIVVAQDVGDQIRGGRVGDLAGGGELWVEKWRSPTVR